MNPSLLRLLAVPAILLVGLSACASTREWSAAGGNRESGLVRVSYQYSEFHQPDVSDAQAMELAEHRCEAWGFKHAEPVAGLVRECSNKQGGDCDMWKVTREFQCRADEGDASYAVRLSR